MFGAIMKRIKLRIYSAIVAIIGVIGLTKYLDATSPLKLSIFNQLYENPNIKPEGPLKVFHLGHSLVGRDMPSMVKQLANAGHSYKSQLGWGTPLKAHWEENVPINGFKEENDHPNYLAAHDAVHSGRYDALILTEMVELKDSIDCFDSYLYLYKWSSVARMNNPDIRIYFYETWHELNDHEGWLTRLDHDLAALWEKEILRRALAIDPNPKPIYIIPGGQVMARFVRHIEELGGIGPIKTRRDLFTDDIHFNDYGAYLIALTHYSVLYQQSPIGLTHSLRKADGSIANDPGPEAAAIMQRIVWEVVTNFNKTGILKRD